MFLLVVRHAPLDGNMVLLCPVDLAVARLRGSSCCWTGRHGKDGGEIVGLSDGVAPHVLGTLGARVSEVVHHVGREGERDGRGGGAGRGGGGGGGNKVLRVGQLATDWRRTKLGCLGYGARRHGVVRRD